MLRKNKCFLEGVNMVESQIIYNDTHEDQKHRRRLTEALPQNFGLTQRKSYNYQVGQEAYHLASAASKDLHLNISLKGRQSAIDPTPTTFTHRTDTGRCTKSRLPSDSMKETSRLGDDRAPAACLRQC